MPSLITPSDVSAVGADGGLSPTDLQTVIDREEAELIRRFGAHADGVTAITETQMITGADLFLARPVASLTSIAVVAYVGAASSTLAVSQYYVVPPLNQVRIAPFLRDAFVTVTYVPKDDRPLRKQVLIELVRIAVEQDSGRGVQGLSFGITPSRRSADEWQQARDALYGRLGLVAV